MSAPWAFDFSKHAKTRFLISSSKSFFSVWYSSSLKSAIISGFKISLIYLFQVIIISTIAMIIGLIGSTILLSVVDYSFASRVIVNFDILHNTVYGIGGVILLAYLTPIIAIAFPLFSLSRKKPIDVIKVS